MRARRGRRAVVVAALTALLFAAGLAVGEAPASAQPATCSVTNADGGIDVSWQSVPDATTYVYRLEVAGKNNRYRRVNDTSTSIPLEQDEVGTVFVSAVFSDGSYSPSVSCGSGQANDGTVNPQPTCSVSDADSGIDVTWSEIDGAQAYVFRLEVAGQNNQYRRVSGTNAFIGLEAGTVGSVFVSGVLFNGAYTPAISCGSGSPLDGTGQQNPTCSAESAEGGVRISWTEIANADRYVYRLEVDGQNNTYGNAPVSDDPSIVVSVPAGVEGTLAVSAAFADGSYSPGVRCGSAIGGGGGGSIAAPAECSASPAPEAANVQWTAVDGAESYIVLVTQVREADEFLSIETSAMIPLALNLGTATVSVRAVDSDGNQSESTACGTVDPGVPLGPVCAATTSNGNATVSWTNISTWPTSFVEVGYTLGGGTEQTTTVINGTSVDVALGGQNLTAARTRARIVVAGPGGPQTMFTEWSDCELTNGGVQFPAGPAECAITNTSNDSLGSINVDWSAVGIPALTPTQTATYQVLLQISNGGANFIEAVAITTTSFDSLPRGDLEVETPWVLYNGDVVDASVRVSIRDTTSPSLSEGQSTDCGSVTIANSGDVGGNAEGPEFCNLDGSTLTFSNPFNDTVRVRLDPFRAPHLFAFVGGSTSYEVQNVPSAAAGTRVFLAKVDDFDVPSAEIACGTITLN